MSKLKTRLEYNNKNNKYIESLKKVYLIGHWARYGVLELPYAGKMVEDDLFYMTPLVYDLDDHNGTYAEYILTKINDVTTGDIIIYTFNRNLAQTLSDRLNEYKSCQTKEQIYKGALCDLDAELYQQMIVLGKKLTYNAIRGLINQLIEKEELKNGKGKVR